MLLSLLCILSFGDWRIETEEVFTQITERATAIGPGGIYVSAGREGYIHHFSLEGETLATIGKKGQGPGEFQFVASLWIWEGTLYATDFRKISRFKPDGTFIDSFDAQGFGRIKTATGWAWVKRPNFRSDETGYALIHSGPQMEDEKTLLAWEDDQGPMVVPKGETMVMKFNPARASAHLIASVDGKTLYFTKGKRMEIQSYDVQTGKPGAVFSAKVEKMPFNEEWGKEKLAEMKERPSPLKFEADFPEYWPAVGRLWLDPYGNLWACHWTEKESGRPEPVVFNSKGETIDAPFSEQIREKLIGWHGEFAYLCIYDPDGDDPAAIVRHPIKDLANFKPGS